MKTLGLYALAAIAEIGGCFAFWAWLRLGYSALWAIPGAICLIFFAYILTFTPADFAGKSYAAYGGVYIVASLFWLWLAENKTPDHWDLAGAALCLCGASLMIFAPRGN